MQQVTVVSIDSKLEPDYTLLIARQFNILSRHQHVLNLQLFNKKVVALVESSVPYGPRQLRLLHNIPKTDEFLFSTTPLEKFSCDIEFSLNPLNLELLELSWQVLIREQRVPVDRVQIITQQYLRIGIANLLDALATRSSLYKEVSNLLGLGFGLTPSGDDFLCGLLIALCLPQSPFHSQRKNLVQAILANIQQTNPISVGFLKDACLSQVSQPVQLFIHNLLSPFSSPAVIQGVVKLGHRSGYDLLSGLLAGFPHLTTKRVYLCPYIVD